MRFSQLTLFPAILVTQCLSLPAAPPADYPFPFEPDPHRFDSEINQFAKADASAMPPQGAVACVGSSSMRMWHERIKDDLLGLTVIPRGFGGSHFSDAIYFAEELILKYRPRALLLYEGDNDSADGKSPQRILTDLQYLVALCRSELPDLRIYVISIKPSKARWNIWPRMQTANRLMREWCKATEGLAFIDADTALLDEHGELRKGIFIDDQLHLNQHGYDLWAAAIRPILLKGELAHE